MSMDWSVFEEAVEDRPALLEDMLSSLADDTADDSESTEDLLTRLQRTLSEDRDALFVSFLQQEVQAVLRLSTTPSPTVGFFDLGMDSLMAVELRNRLNRAFAGEYTASNTIIFDYPDIASLAGHLAEELGSLGAPAAAAPAPQPAAPEPRTPARTDDDAIAVVGMACRFPGAADLDAFWQLLESGTDAITTGRKDGGSWSGAVGDPDAKDVARTRGAFVDGIDWFDSRFFRISPIEARMMDPQQRMLLETTWQAIEDAGMDPNSLRGSRTGVYAGVGASEYRDLFEASNKGHNYLGTTASVAAGRVAFALGLEGPAMPIDMACASSLAAVHQAVVGLQRCEVDLALAGGVNAILSPGVSGFMMDAGMLSPTGHCSPFDASADGYVRGEGCGVVVLKRLSQAEADGDRIWAVVRGSAVNQNGASAGLTTPNGQAQRRIMEEALAQSGVSPSDVDYLEAHATGSQLGDPIELNAAASVYGEGRDENRPLLVGSVKANIGHTEAAAGIAAFIKTVLSINHGQVPKHLHFEDPNPNVEWDQIPVRVPSDTTAWPNGNGRQPLAGVNAFGLSGANAHVLVEGYNGTPGDSATINGNGAPSGCSREIPVSLPEAADTAAVTENGTAERITRILPLSGKSPEAQNELARRYLSQLNGENGADSDATLSDMAWTASVGRSHFDYRTGVVFDDAESLRKALSKITGSDGESGSAEPRSATRTAFLYTGDGSQWVGMGKALYDSEPVARAILDRCDAIVQAERGDALLDVMFGAPDAAGDLSDAAWAHPALYALQCALTALWASIGIRPNAVLGRGTGEIAAAQAAGIFSLEEGMRWALTRSKLMAVLPGVDPTQSQRGLEMEFAAITASPPSLPVVSGLTGQVMDSDSPVDGAYWVRQARESAALGTAPQRSPNSEWTR